MVSSMEMPDHIVAHSMMVCRVALVLTDHLIGNGISLNRELIRASALVHDITKSRSFKTGENHDFTGGEYLKKIGYPEVADIVRQHVRLDDYFEADVPNEAEVVNYADKRVLHENVTSLRKRRDYILERYGIEPEIEDRIRKLWKKTEEMEVRIFKWIPFPPEALETHINHHYGPDAK